MKNILQNIIRLHTKGLFVFVLGFFGILVTAVIPLFAFEAHVINVTATIERPPCEEFEVRSLGYWKNHSENWILPQVVGDITVSTAEQAEDILKKEYHKSQFNKLRGQLLALKFSISFFPGSETGLVPGESITVGELADLADALLSEVPQAPDSELAAMRERVESVNTAEMVSTCPEETAILTQEVGDDGESGNDESEEEDNFSADDLFSGNEENSSSDSEGIAEDNTSDLSNQSDNSEENDSFSENTTTSSDIPAE